MPKRPAAKYTTDFSGVRGIVPPRPHKYKKKRIHEEPAYGASTSSTSAMEESLVSSFTLLPGWSIDKIDNR